jgi:hypothetical protein
MKLLAMNLFVGAISASLIAPLPGAHAGPVAPPAAGGSPYQAVSDFDGPYSDLPPPPPAVIPAPRYGYGPGPDYGYRDRDYGSRDDRYVPERSYRPEPYRPDYRPDYGYAPAFVPLHEVYAILRDNGFSPLGAPRQRGNMYVIAALDRQGDDGKVVIDARSGRIVRFVPASRWGDDYEQMRYAPAPRGGIDNLPPPVVIKADGSLSAPSPALPAVPQVANRSAPLAMPRTVAPAVANRPVAPSQQTAAIQTKPVESRPAAVPPPPSRTAAAAVVQQPAAVPSSTPQAAASNAQAQSAVAQKPAPQILPSGQMPPVQGLE